MFKLITRSHLPAVTSEIHTKSPIIVCVCCAIICGIVSYMSTMMMSAIICVGVNCDVGHARAMKTGLEVKLL